MLAACAHEQAPAPTVTVQPLPAVSASAATTSPSPSASATPAAAASTSAPVLDAPPSANLAAAAAMRPGIRRCYNAELKNNRSAQGKIVLEVQIAGDGSVTSAALRGTSPFSSSVEKCVLAVARATVFEATGKSGSTLILPFTLVSAP